MVGRRKNKGFKMCDLVQMKFLTPFCRKCIVQRHGVSIGINLNNLEKGPSPSEEMQKEGELSSQQHKKSKKGIIYLSSIPPYMNVTKIREHFNEFGKVGRVYLQLVNKDVPGDKKKKSRRVAKKFSEGWVEFDKKVVAKRVANLLNNTQVSNRKSSKLYDHMWHIKYLSGFKWPHLHERLAYEKAARNKKLKAEIQLAKKKSNFFTSNLDIGKKNKDTVNKEYENIEEIAPEADMKDDEEPKTRNEFLKSLFS